MKTRALDILIPLLISYLLVYLVKGVNWELFATITLVCPPISIVFSLVRSRRDK